VGSALASREAPTLSDLRIEPAGPEHEEGLSALFERNDSPCFCRWWHFEGDKNAWEDRCANAPAESRRELSGRLAGHSDEARGLVALGDGQLVGWMKLSPAGVMQKLYAQRLYRGLPCFEGERSGVFTIGCFLVDEAWRRRGVARALVDAAVEIAPRWGARALEAFPRRGDALSAQEMWTGPAEALTDAGFREVFDFKPYPVLRRELTPVASSRESG